jgi:hypothetical protein
LSLDPLGRNEVHAGTCPERAATASDTKAMTAHHHHHHRKSEPACARMRIIIIIVASMMGAGLLVAAASGTLAYHEWDRLSAVREAESLVEVIGAANQFVETMALERGVYNQVVVSTTGHPETKQRL